MRRSFTVLLTGALLASLIALPAGDALAKKKKKKAPACAAFVPGELGVEAETLKVTDAHTADAPLLAPISLDAAFDEGILEFVGAGETPRAYFNVQVDSAAPTAGLYVTWEFQTHRDYDLWAYFSDGSAAASAHGFQPMMDTKGTPADQSNTASNHAGESTADSENLVGVTTPDCGGYTIESSTYFGEGGDFEVKVWLGDAVTEPGVPE